MVARVSQDDRAQGPAGGSRGNDVASDALLLEQREPLAPTALKILEAAKRIVAKSGLEALTLDAIAHDAEVNKAATHYYFGSKAGLLQAMVDEIVLDECARLTHDIPPGSSLEERLDALLEGVRRLALDESSYGGWFDIVPYSIRASTLRVRIVALYQVWYRYNLEWAGLLDPDGTLLDERFEGMGRLIAAIVDGIALQVLLEGSSYDPEPTLKTLRHWLESVLGPTLEELGAVST